MRSPKAARAALAAGTQVSLFGSRTDDQARGGDIDRLEKLGYLDGEAWLRWREIRNRLAHEYPDAPELRHAQLPAAIAGAADMLAAYRLWAGRLP